MFTALFFTEPFLTALFFTAPFFTARHHTTVLCSVLAQSELAIGEIFVLAGFLVIYLIEELGHWALVRYWTVFYCLEMSVVCCT